MVDVLFFAELQEAIGSDKLSFEAEGMTIKELKEKWLSSVERIDHAMIAVNEEYREEDFMLNNGDTVAFIPPVSGG